MSRDDMAIDPTGEQDAMAPGEVRSTVMRMLDDGTLIAVILRAKDGSVGVQVFGPPSTELLDILESAWHGYKRVMELRTANEPAPALILGRLPEVKE